MRDRDRDMRDRGGREGDRERRTRHRTCCTRTPDSSKGMRARTGSSQLVPAERRAQSGRRGREGRGWRKKACCARSSQVCVGTALVELVSSACQPRPRLPLPAAPALLLAGSLQSAHGPCCACVFAGVLLLGRPREGNARFSASRSPAVLLAHPTMSLDNRCAC